MTGPTMLLPVSDASDTVRLDPTTTAIAATKDAPAGSIAPRDFGRALRGRAAAVAAWNRDPRALPRPVPWRGLFGPPRPSDAPSALSTSSTTSSSTTSSTTSSSTTTTILASSSVTSAASAAGNVVAALNAGVTNGTVAPAAGQQLDNQLQPLLFSQQPEPAAQQVQQFDQLVQSFDQDVANGQIRGRSTRLLQRAINRLAVALGTTVPTATTTPTPAPPGPNGPDPGNGHGKGHGKGAGKHH